MKRLEGKVAIITGAGSGFGSAIARRFAAEGAKVVLADVNIKRVDDELADIGADAIAVQADVSRKDDMEDLARQAFEAFGRIDIMVNNAGFTHRNMALTEVDEDNFDLINAVNMKAIYHSTLIVVPIMEHQGGGIIINTASATAMRPRKGLTWYCASKGWVVSATKAMALELAEKKIRVNCICPAESDGEGMGLFLEEDTPQARKELKASIPMGRFSRPEDIAEAALWLASDQASMVTGTALAVDGGYTI
ncbi:SDR family oxidoreductase [Falsochrobactrum sp. TDYN1]|uniref:SDR family oxidoreductase n=1 Tax=Falsochrobactrum tianjinense TaxID=2706015 RepID=A0A949PN52_9HYPH|nr:SDR family oxidoreductase [Falsochrobactrum sp. TDYN1]MBV2143717.1 SDR family oxidoreductase [Falsochrobactrum sp. TDYN1]